MYRILIVDDEALIRKRIRYGFEWEQEGFIIAGEAENGQHALEILEQEPFDLAIVDIAMPGVDGIELIKRIRNQRIPIEIIFLTGHSEFEYARIALQERVFAYALKPLNEKEFMGIIREIKAKIDEERCHAEEFESLHNKQEQMEFMLKNQQFVEQLYTSSTTGNPEDNNREFLLGSRLVIISIASQNVQNEVSLHLNSQHGSGTPYKSVKFEDYLALQQKLKELLPYHQTNHLYFDINHIYFDMQSNEIFLLVKDEVDKTEECFVFMEQFYQNITDELKLKMKLGVSRVIKTNDQLFRTYHQAIRCVRNCLINGRAVNIFENVEEAARQKYILPNDYSRELKIGIETGDAEIVNAMLKKIFQEMLEKRLEYQEILRISEQILTIFSEIAASKNLDIKVAMGDYYTVEAAFRFMENHDEIPKWFQSIAKNMLQLYSEGQGRNTKNEIAVQAKAYVREHYMEQELSVKTLAQYLFVTDTYVSASFKRAMGISLVQYITQCRLEKARELLRTGKYDVSQSALMVGYGDEYYFSRCYKKYFGVSPFQDKKWNDR